MTVYVKRDALGNVVAISREPLSAAFELVEDDAPEVVAFTHALAEGQTQLTATDLGLARVVEDLIGLLIKSGTIRFTDFPDAVQTKLMERRSLRDSMHSLNILDDEHKEGFL